MTSILILGAHILPEMLGRHAAAVRAACPGATIQSRSIVAIDTPGPPSLGVIDRADMRTFRAPAQFGILSGAYQWFAEQITVGHDSLAEAVLAELAPPGVTAAFDVVLVVGWSAGGAFVRELARLPLPAARWGLVCCDGGYGALANPNVPGTPAPADVAVWVEAAQRGTVLAMDATTLDYVETELHYASTQDVLRHIRYELTHDTQTRPAWPWTVTVQRARLVQLDHADHPQSCAVDGPPLTAWAAQQCLAAQGGAPPSEPPSTLPTGTPVTQPPPAAQPRGIDVSVAQGPGAANAWDRWDVQFGAARCSSGNQVDPTFAGNVVRMRGAQLVAEISTHYVNGRPGQFEAIWSAHQIANAELSGRLIALDIEPWDPQSRVTPDWVAAMSSGIVEELVRRLQALGARVGIYSSAWALDCVPGLAARLLALGVWWWIADGSPQALTAGHPVLGLPKGVELERVKFWQRGRRGAFGEPVPVDDDEFLGSLDELRSFARGTLGPTNGDS